MTFPQLTPVAAVLASCIALYLFHHAVRGPRTRRLLGPPADWWETLRAAVLPRVDTVVSRATGGRLYTAYQIQTGENVGRIDRPPEEVEQLLYGTGARRQPLAAFKTLIDGEPEVGSWCYRRSLLARYQTHVILFRVGEDDDQTSVYAHREYNPTNPLVALKHYRGEYYNEAGGGKDVRRRIPEDVWMK